MSTGQPAIPRWMHDVEEAQIGESDWMYGSKPALRAGMSPRFEFKTNVWICGLLASHGYKGECAMTMANNFRVPLTAGIIAKQIQKVHLEYYEESGIALTEEQKKAMRPTRQHVRRALEEIEGDGCCERRLADGRPVRSLPPEERKRLQAGKVRLHFFLRPRRPSRRPALPQVASNGYIRFPGCSPAESVILCRVLREFGSVPAEYVANGGYRQDVAKAAVQDYIQAETVAARRLAERLDVAKNEQRFENHKHENQNPESNNNSTEPPVPPPDAAPQPDVVVAQEVLAELEKHGHTTLKAAQQFLAACRRKRPNASAAIICQVIREIAATINPQARNPIGILLRQVPLSLEHYQADSEMVQLPGMRPMTREDALAMLDQILKGNESTAEEKQWARGERDKLVKGASASTVKAGKA